MPVLAYAVLIFAVSSMPQPPQPPIATPDKGIHLGEYAVLGALLVRALGGGWGGRVTIRVALLATMLSASYGATDEIHQYFVPPREMEALDLAADALGAALAAFGLLLPSLFRRR